MRVAIVNERCYGGGTENQVQFLRKKLIAEDHEVCIITFDAVNPDKATQLDCQNIDVSYETGLRKWKRQLVGDKQFNLRLRELLSNFAPDVIHINNVFSFQRDVYAVTRDYPVVQTLRDYSVVCPLDVCVDGSYVECCGYESVSSCCKCGNAAVMALKRGKLRLINSWRLRAVDCFAAPSFALAEKCTKNGITARQLKNVLDSSKEFKHAPTPNSKNYLYYGKISKIKGVEILLRAFAEFHELHPECVLHLAGSVDENMIAVLDEMKSANWLVNHGLCDSSMIEELYRDLRCVVVPSLWIENYPNTVLEALANYTLVIGSNRGGIPELIASRDFLFDVTDMEAVIRCLNLAYEIESTEYNAIVRRNRDRVTSHNAPEAFYTDTMNIYSEAIAKSNKHLK